MYKCRQKYSQTVYGCTSACLGCPDVLVVEEAGGDVVVEVGPPVNTTHWHLSPHWPQPSLATTLIKLTPCIQQWIGLIDTTVI